LAAENREFSEVYHLIFNKVAYIEKFFCDDKFQKCNYIIIK